MKPFLKWAGNKYRIIHKIKEFLPEGGRLIEPFAGAAAVFLNTDFSKYLVADTNRDLIHLYQHLQSDRDAWIKYAQSYFTSKNNTAERYYALRMHFNKTTDTYERSAMFLYFNKHGYNGLCRYNSSGGFNVPFGRYDHPYFPEQELRHFSEKSKKAKFFVSDFLKTMDQAKRGDVVYCDPPYVPLSRSAHFCQYYNSGFTEAQQVKLAEKALELKAKNIPVIISNHDTPYTRKLYSSATQHYFEVQRNISCDGKMRRTAPELLAIFE